MKVKLWIFVVFILLGIYKDKVFLFYMYSFKCFLGEIVYIKEDDFSWIS